MENTVKTEDKQRLKRAFSPNEILRMKKKTIRLDNAWFDAFGEIEATGVVFIWGNSGNGKSSFVMQLCKKLSQHGKVLYNSLEEGVSFSTQKSLRLFKMKDVNRRLLLVDSEDKETFSERLLWRKCADFVVIDSFQYFGMNYADYKKFKQKHKDKLLIFISHADGRSPAGRTAKSVMFDAMLKIWVEGYRAFSKGRFIGKKGYYDIWMEKAIEYWRN